uniref:Cystatin domain-containing protein n=1 Tax=Cynoglossus semilaevis TaxID=244447 RepID=A0A3P8UWM5_CYNSE
CRRGTYLPVVLAGVGRAVGSHGGRYMPGSVVNVNRDDRGLQQAVLAVAYSFNNQSNDAFLFKPLAIRTAKKQVRPGVHYIVDLDICRTVCRKQINNTDFSHCNFQPEPPLKQIFQCHSDIWIIPWRKQTKVVGLTCKP